MAIDRDVGSFKKTNQFPIKSYAECTDYDGIKSSLQRIRNAMYSDFGAFKKCIQTAVNNLNKDTLEIDGATFERHLKKIATHIDNVKDLIVSKCNRIEADAKAQRQSDLSYLAAYNNYIGQQDINRAPVSEK